MHFDSVCLTYFYSLVTVPTRLNTVERMLLEHDRSCFSMQSCYAWEACSRHACCSHKAMGLAYTAICCFITTQPADYHDYLIFKLHVY